MNNNIDLTKILKDCPKGTLLWSDNYGKVEFLEIDKSLERPIVVKLTDGYTTSYTKEGWCSINYPASCLLFPSKEQRDWSKFTAPWYKKEKFDPKTLKPFDKILVKYYNAECWSCGFFSHINESEDAYRYATENNLYTYCIPYNEDTKHLVGTTEEAPEYYKHWED